MTSGRGGAEVVAGTSPTTPPRRRAGAAQRDNPDAYIAGDRRRALAAGRELPDRVEGAAIFADISGFTPLTEELVKELGPQRGAEELTAALDVVFDAVLGELHRFGGSVIYFSGDAVTCWLDRDDGTLGVSCALAMQRAMSSVCRITTPGGTDVELGMKVAVAAGPARRFVVGDPDIQLIDVLAGSLMDRLAEAEHHGERGEVLVDGRTLDTLGGRIEVATVRGDDDDRVAVVESVLTDVGKLPAPAPYPRLSRAVVRKWLLPAVYERMRTGRGEFLNELRPAVPVFVRFGGIDYDAEDDAPLRLDEFIRRAQWVVDAHGGNVLQLTIGDKGAYLYTVFGSPLAHEDDAVRACAASLDLLALEGETAAAGLQVGIAKGRVRSGTYGHRQRRTFCCLGDPVNLSARLMSAANPGTAYVTPEVAKSAEGRFAFEELPPMSVKGKTAPVAVRRLIGRAPRAAGRWLHAGHPLVGRAEELDRLVTLAGRAVEGVGQVVALAAEAGMGKSSLAAVLAGVTEDRGVPVFVGAAAAAGGGSYLVWQPVASALFGLSGGEASPGEVVEGLERALGEVDETLLPRLPLLGPLVGTAIVDNELTAGFDAKLRKASLESLVVQYLSVRAARGPIALVLEDCHWIDPLSSDLLDLVARAAANLPLFVLLTYRPGTFVAPALGHTTVVELARLDEESSREILEARLAALYGTDTKPSAALVDRLVLRSEGNPFYVEELASYLHDRGADPSDPKAASLELPTSLATLVLSRIDTLAESPRRTLKVASVVGREFDVGTLSGAYPDLGSPRQLAGHLRQLRAEDLVVLEDPSSDRYSFKHAVIQEVAYESLPFALRENVHGRVGVWIEATDPESLDLLAHHFWHSREEGKKREYLRRAGDAAKARYANEAAADYFQRLAPLVDDAAREDVLTQLGAVLGVRGEWSEAESVYRQVIELADRRRDAAAAGWARVSVCEPLMNGGRYQEASAELDAAERLFAEVDDAAGFARVEHFRGMVANQTGAPGEADEHFRRSLEARKTLGDTLGVATTLINLAVAAGHKGDYDEAEELFEESLALRTALGDRRYMGLIQNNLAMVAYLQDDYHRAVPHFEEAIRLGTEIGCPLTVAVARQGLGNCLRELGDRRGALEHYAYAVREYTVAGDHRDLCYVIEDVAIASAESTAHAAFRLIGAADALRAVIGSPRMDYEQEALDDHLAAAAGRLGASARREIADGAELGLHDAVALCEELCGS